MDVNSISFTEKEVKKGKLTEFLQLLLNKQLDNEPIGDKYPKFDIRIWFDGMTTVLEYVELLFDDYAYEIKNERMDGDV